MVGIFITKEYIMELNRFKQLLESTMGNVKPLIKESPDSEKDFILTKDEMTCMTPRVKESHPNDRWYITDDKTQIQFGLVTSGNLKPYCTFDINNRPLHPTKEYGRFEYDKNTGVVSFF
jgi:hypothetical protein